MILWRRKLDIFLSLIITILLFNFTAYSEDRYEYICKGANESMFYLDKFSITHTDTPNVLRCWYKDMVSDLERQRYIASSSNGNLYKLSYVLYCFEINLAQNTYKGIEEYTYDSHGYIIDKRTSTRNVWETIPPNSVMAAMSKAIKQITRDNTTQKHTAFSVVMIALMLGALVSTLLVLFYIEFTSSSSSKQSVHTETTPNENFNTEHEETAFAEEKIKDDFDYPYEDIGKVTGI